MEKVLNLLFNCPVHSLRKFIRWLSFHQDRINCHLLDIIIISTVRYFLWNFSILYNVIKPTYLHVILFVLFHLYYITASSLSRLKIVMCLIVSIALMKKEKNIKYQKLNKAANLLHLMAIKMKVIITQNKDKPRIFYKEI